MTSVSVSGFSWMEFFVDRSSAGFRIGTPPMLRRYRHQNRPSSVLPGSDFTCRLVKFERRFSVISVMLTLVAVGNGQLKLAKPARCC